MTGIVFVTGGLDSTLVMIRLLKSGHTITPFFIDYNQWQSEEEIKSVKKILNWFSVSDFSSYRQLGQLKVLKVDFPNKVGHSAFRPLAFAGLAGMIAENEGRKIDFIATGYHGEHSKYTEARFSSQEELGQLIEKWYGIKYVHPLGTITNAEVGKELASLPGFDFRMIYNCFWSPPCGSKSPDDTYLCGGCRGKVEAMKAAGITDEEWLRRPNAR